MGLQLKHITSTATFNTTKFSASSGDNTYFTGSDPNTQVAGTPDILYKDLVFCKCNGKIYTHGKFYDTGDGSNDFTSYLHKLTTKNVILSGFDVYRIQSVSSYPWYRRNGGMVYLRNINQIVKVETAGYETTQMSNPDIQDSIWWDNEGYYFLAPVDYTPAQGKEKVCDWSDLARLTDLEVVDIPLATTTTKGLMSAEDKMKISIFNTNSFNFSSSTLQEACQTLISTINNTQKNDNYQLFDGTFGSGNLYMYHGCAYPNLDMLQYSAFLIMNVATGSLYKCGYTAGNWYCSTI